jgi:hypothetical protein
VIRSKNPIARLPYGVNVHKENQGWRVRLGKRFTGGAAVRKRFDKLADARAWICSQEGQKSHIQATALTPSQLAEAKDAFTKLNGASLAQAVRYYLAHAKPAGGTKKIEEAIDAVLKSKADAGRSRLHVRHLGWSLKKFGAAFPKHNRQPSRVAPPVSQSFRANYLPHGQALAFRPGSSRRNCKCTYADEYPAAYVRLISLRPPPQRELDRR